MGPSRHATDLSPKVNACSEGLQGKRFWRKDVPGRVVPPETLGYNAVA